jgi:hypothetical protein
MRKHFMKTHAASVRFTGAAARYLDTKVAAGRVAFPLADLAADTRLSLTAAKHQLLRLGNRVVRPAAKHPFYLIVGPEHRAVGAPPVQWWLDDYFKWLGHPYYLALQSAAGIYGSNAQAIQVTQVITDGPRRDITVGRLQIRCFVKRSVARTPTQPLANAYAPLRVSTPEATAFDLVAYAPRIGGIGRVAETLAPLLPRLRAAELRQVLEIEQRTTTAQRLGYLLENAGNPKLAEVVHAWLPRHVPATPLALSATDRTKATLVARWQILDNSSELQS